MGNRFCRICGEHKPLTLEHIPPRSTGNDHVVVVHRGDEAVLHSLFDMEVRDDDGYRQSHGMTFKTLCEDCNEYLGDITWKRSKACTWISPMNPATSSTGSTVTGTSSRPPAWSDTANLTLGEGVPFPGVRQAGGVELLRHDGAG